MTTPTQYTPGPWETSSNANGEWDVCMEDAGDMIADLSGTDNQEANARLIAAAPELLAALEGIRPLFDNDSALLTIYSTEVEACGLAIAHARGMKG